MFKDDEKHKTCYCESCLALQQKLQAKEQECEKMKKFEQLFYKVRELYLRDNNVKRQLIDENEYLKDTIKRFTCQAECYKHKESKKYKQALDEIEKQIRNEIVDENLGHIILNIINKAKDGE